MAPRRMLDEFPENNLEMPNGVPIETQLEAHE